MAPATIELEEIDLSRTDEANRIRELCYGEMVFSPNWPWTSEEVTHKV